MPRPLQVFLCHASQDKPAVRRLYFYLIQRGAKPWLDQVDLIPGQNFEVEIPKALDASDIILVCLSKNSVNKEGYVQKEIAFALDKALEKPQGTIFIIPVKLEDCELPRRLSPYHSVDLFRTDGRKRLLLSLNKRVTELGSDVSPIIVEDTRQKKLAPKPLNFDQVDGDAVEKIIEKADQEVIEKALREKAINEVPKSNNFVVKSEFDKKRKQAKPFTRVLDPSSLAPQQQKQIKKDIQRNSFPRIFLGAFIFLGLLTIFMAGNLIAENFSANPTPTLRDSSIETKSLVSTATEILLTPTITLTPTSTLGIGSTMISEKDGMLLVYVPAGEFTMGSDNGSADEKPVHQIYLDAFWIDQTEVTNAMYELCVNDNQCDPPNKLSSYTRSSYYSVSEFYNFPVLNVSWDDAKAYCEWADRRLPTEAEWEKAARGIDGSIYPWGNNAPASDFLNYNNEVGETSEVGNYPQGTSIYGAFDMSGNVWEWVNDWYDSSYYQNSPLSNPSGPSTGEYRVQRGGSWFSDFGVRSASRYWEYPVYTDDSVGFRCSRSP